MSDQKNLVIAIVLSLVILIGSQWLFPPTSMQPPPQDVEQSETGTVQAPPEPGTATAPSVPGGATDTTVAQTAASSRSAALEKNPRVTIDAKRVRGSLSLRGARIDDIILRDYKQTIEPDSKPVVLLSPAGAPKPYYGFFGWAAVGDLKVPDINTVWKADADTLTSARPVTLRWDNGQGVTFEKIISVDNNFMFTVTQRVINNGDSAVTVYPYGSISRLDTPSILDFYILHEGPIGVSGGTLKEVDYDDLQETKKHRNEGRNDWIGITDKYWLAAMVPDPNKATTGEFRYYNENGRDRYQANMLTDAAVQVPAGGTSESTMRLFAGAKEVNLLDRYQEQLDIKLFDKAVDFGWFYWLTKPIFYALDYFFHLLGNFGLAIMALTVCIKLIFFPLANKSYKAMSKMKTLQPKMMELREKYGDDRQKLNQEMMELYKKEKVNPAAGCLPILVQIPVFFCLYKVMFVTIEMRHQPFYGWIEDLAAPDPLSIFTLFGLVPWDTPGWLPVLGIWPILMGISMYLQQLLNPQPADPVQAKIFLFMPLFFTFLLAAFPAGLVIYWTWNNILSVAQQWVIMKRMGAPIGRNAAAKTS